MKVSSILACAALAAAICHSPANASQGKAPSDMAIDKKVRNEVIDRLIVELDGKYVFPPVAKRIEKMLRTKQKAGDFDQLTSARQFSAKLTESMAQVAHDGHLHVSFSEQAMPADGERVETPEQQARDLAGLLDHLRRINNGVQRLERLSGNVGLLELRGFTPARHSGHAITAAMTLLAGTDALIIDLRKNRGGAPDMVALVASYFFEGRTRLNDIYWREGDATVQMWSSDYLEGPRYGKHVYILTSKGTFSAAEDFSYAMQTLKRATIVGETSGGGAHPGAMARLHAHFLAFIPAGRSINPVTKTDWEGVGVIPDVKASAEEALGVAHRIALEKLLAASSDEHQKAGLARALADLAKNPLATAK